MLGRRDYSVQWEVELCPRTDLRVMDVERDEPYAGNMPPLMAQSNMRVRCGEDGSLTNRCVVYEGASLLLNTFSMSQEYEAKNVVFEGITFERGVESFLELTNGGDITFRNCLFRVSDQGTCDTGNKKMNLTF